ncbi:unnamed protein product [Caenorhabditis sp. 36 PRJEB53466]|nr:unnamed protein product [Caenorhabditis sp. 36 PRJEB53466]
MIVEPSDADASVKLQKAETEFGNTVKSLDERKTKWFPMWIIIGMQFVGGIQMSVYYMSMWPYLSGLDKTADMGFLGWVVAACNLGCCLTSPLFGYWNQKTLSCKWPTIAGLFVAAAGQVMYALISKVEQYGKWYMLAARVITGFGVGNTAAMRAYAATASTPDDRLKAISYGIASSVLGISFGPVISAAFTPLGEKGFDLGMVNINMYTAVAYLMAFSCLASAFVMYMFFTEHYAGIVEKETVDEKTNTTTIVPKYDMIPALICIYLNMMCTMMATIIEVMSTPLTTVMYDWKDSESISYNGILEFLACIISVLVNLSFGKSWIGNWDRRLQIMCGLGVFAAFNLINYPWWFYTGPLNFLPPGANTTEIGGCLHSYTWCKYTTRIPLYLYIFAFVFLFGISFPFVEAPASALYSEILGPRKQGNMQGWFNVGGNITPFLAAIICTYLFQHVGYKYVILFQSATLFTAFLLVILFTNVWSLSSWRRGLM